MKRWLSLWLGAAFAALILFATLGMSEWSFSQSMKREELRARSTVKLLALTIAESTGKLDAKGWDRFAAQNRGLAEQQGVELIFVDAHEHPLGGARLPSREYDALLTGQPSAMLDSSLKTYAVAEPLADGFTLLALNDVRDFYAQRARMRGWGIFSAIAGALLAVIASMLISARFSRPVLKISQALNALGEDSAARVGSPLPLRRGDEIGSLARALDGAGAAIRQREAELRTQAEERRRLLDALTCEMRAPLDALLENARILGAEPLPAPRQAAIAESMSKEIMRLSDMDRQLLKLTSLRHEPIEKNPVSIRTLMKDTIERLQPQAGGVLLVLGRGDCQIQGDAALLSLMLDHLSLNALRASAEGQTVLLEPLPNGFCVSDAGCGIDGTAARARL